MQSFYFLNVRYKKPVRPCVGTMLLSETDLCISAEGVERQGSQHRAILGQTGTDLLQGDWKVLKHSIGLAQHIQPLRETTDNENNM